MSKISVDFKLKDLFAIKHALESHIRFKNNRIQKLNAYIKGEELVSLIIETARDIENLQKDIEHETNIVYNIVEVINKYRKTEAHLKE